MQGVGYRDLSAATETASAGKVAGLHSEVAERCQSAVLSWGCAPTGPEAQGALALLLRGKGVYATSPSHMAPFSNSLLSVPTSIAGSPVITQLLGEQEVNFLEGYKALMLRPPSEVEQLDEMHGPIKAYTDPLLRKNRRIYAAFIKRLKKIGMVTYSRSAKCVLGVFFVRKKDGRIRLILDCRPCNRVFGAPPGVELVTA